MTKTRQSKTLLDQRVHPAILLLLSLLLLLLAFAGVSHYKRQIISQYDHINKVAASTPKLVKRPPAPTATTSEPASTTPEGGAAQPSATVQTYAPKNTSRARSGGPVTTAPNNAPPGSNNPPPGQPKPQPEAAPTASLICVFTICL